MCGIVGFSGKPNDGLLRSMNKLIFHRGPDDEGYYSDQDINLAMRRLSIIDLQTGDQPIPNEDKSIWVVFNGELYNYKEIRLQLEESGHLFKTHSDTEIIVHSYEQWGDGFVNRLNGMFAIALWIKSEKQLILYRDRAGIKPLFYSLINGRLLFASEINSLLINPDFSKEIDFESLHHYFSLKNVPAPKTIFKNIFSVMPGEKLVFKNGVLNRSFYWKLKYKENRDLTEQTVSKTIVRLLDDAVKIRMVADVPVGAYLSGGVDSSTVVAMMSKHASGTLKTFCLGYEDDFKNKAADMHFARKVSKFCGTDHYEYIMKAKEIPADISAIISSFSEPFSGVVSTFYLSKLIRKHVKVALSGDGADEMFGSYLAHRLAIPIKNYYLNNMDNRVITDSDKTLLGHFYDNIDFLKKIADKQDYVWRQRLSVWSEQEKTDLYSDKLLNICEHYDTQQVYQRCFDGIKTEDALNRILACDQKMLLPDQVLPFVDRLSMAHSIEVRPPFLDYRLVEFVATIPGEMKISKSIVKKILKTAVKDVIPEWICNRPKEGFVLPINNWIMSKLDRFIKDTLSEDRLKIHGFFNYEHVGNLLKSHFDRKTDNANKLWNLVCFQVWYERYF